MPLTKAEIQKDLADSQTDIDNCRKAVEGISGFITHNGGEDRRFLRIDLVKWEGILSAGERVHKLIEAALAKATE